MTMVRSLGLVSRNVPWLCSSGVRFTEDGGIVPPKKEEQGK